MRYFRNLIIGFLILISLQMISNFVIQKFHLSFPSPLLGMIFLALILHFKILPIKYIQDTCELLLKNMILFFVPLLVGVILYEKIIIANLYPILLTIIISTISSLIITSKIIDVLLDMKEKSPK